MVSANSVAMNRSTEAPPRCSRLAFDFSVLMMALARLTPDIAAAAAIQDADATFPADELAALADAGLLVATLPEALGGGGLYGADRADDLFALFHGLGQAHAAIGRVFEAHVNALDLIRRYGSQTQLSAAAAAVGNGALYALWVTDRPGNGVTLTTTASGAILGGAKWFCSAAGRASHALITATTPAGVRMLIIGIVPPATITAASVGLAGLRAATTGSVDFTGMTIAADALIGAPDDYLRESVFSTAAWRNYAVILGALAALIGQARTDLAARGRTANPFQRQRFGEAVIAHETGRLWLREAARRAEAAMIDAPDQSDIAYVNFARIAVETACLDAIRLVQRSLGVAAFMIGSPIERIARDLASYLRQPAPDEALDHAAAHWLDNRPDWLAS